MEDHAVPSVDLDTVERDMRAVEQALVRLDDGSYGSCEVCSEPIDDEALSVDPTVTICERHLAIAGNRNPSDSARG